MTGAARSTPSGGQPSSTGLTSVGALLGARRGQPTASREDRDRLWAYLRDISPEFHDAAPRSSVTQALHIFRAANIPKERWGDCLCRARAITKDRQLAGAIQAKAAPIRYYFGVLRGVCGLRETPQHAPPLPNRAARTRNRPPAQEAPRTRDTGSRR